MKKKTLALTMAMALVLSLAACGNSNADVAAESPLLPPPRLLKLLLMRSPRVL